MTAPTIDVTAHGRIAAALAALRALLIAGHVTVRELWAPGWPRPEILEATIFDRPAARDALLQGMTEVTGPTVYQGEYFVYQEWRGKLLTMPLSVVDRLGPVQPGAAERAEATEAGRVPAADPGPVAAAPDSGCPEHGYRCYPDTPGPTHQELSQRSGPDGQPIVRDAATLAAHAVAAVKGIHRGRDMARSQLSLSAAEPNPLLELLAERFGPVPVAPIEVVTGADMSPDEAAALAMKTGRVVVVPGPDADPETAGAYGRYARARALHYFGTRRFPTIDEAREAIRYWPGQDMLTDDDVETVAGALVDPPRVPEPDPVRQEPGIGRRLLSFVRAEATK